MSSVELSTNPDGTYRLVVDGRDMSTAVRRVEIDVEAGCTPEVTLTLRAPRIVTASVDATVGVEQDDIVETTFGGAR